jgi:hypothetical protein
MEKKSIFKEKISDELGPGDLVSIATYHPDDETNHLSYGVVLCAPFEKTQQDMFPSVKIYDIKKETTVSAYSYNLELISSKE